MEFQRPSVKTLIYGTWFVLATGTLAVLIGARASLPSVLDIGILRLGQLLFVAGFAIGALGFANLGYRFYTIGCACMGAVWGILFVVDVIGNPFGDTFAYVLLVPLVVGLMFLIMGIVSDEQAARVLTTVSDRVESGA